MKQVLQSLRDGSIQVADLPSPAPLANELLIGSYASLVSVGTERMLVDFGKASWLQKVRQQPDKVLMVAEKVRTDGIVAAVEAVRAKLEQPLPLGYCNVGQVLALGQSVNAFRVGDRVVSNGGHAEEVCVSQNLCARVPDGITNEHAAFTVLGAIALQGIRLVAPTLGECVVVTGLGLIGLLTVQILRAHGCRVLGVDFDPARLELAARFGAATANASQEDVLAAAHVFSRGRGVDAVLITASTKSSEPVSQAPKMCRKRGRIVLVGVSGLELSRADFYKKEISLQVSCSYGPGRYDPVYEVGGIDYPVGFVRWTEQRNFEAVLDLMEAGVLDLTALITHRFEIERAEEAYDLFRAGKSSLGILLQYPAGREAGFIPVIRRTVELGDLDGEGGVRIACIGAGNYASRVLIPAFKKAGVSLDVIVGRGGVNALHHGQKNGFASVSTDSSAAINASNVNTIVIATRHDSHARYVLEALRAGKNVFVEKPLCLAHVDLEAIEATLSDHPECRLMVGFNRRFAPHVERIKTLLSEIQDPKSLVMMVNAGPVPADHWIQDPQIGGGRLVGEACHFIDLLRYLADSPIITSDVVTLGGAASMSRSDKVTITLRFADGSFGVVHYLANGHRALPKERLEVYCAGRVLQLDNFRKLRGFGWRSFKKMNLWRQDKGAQRCVDAYVNALRNGTGSPIPVDQIMEVSRVCIDLAVTRS